MPGSPSPTIAAERPQWVRYVNGRPMYRRGHRVERRQMAGTSNYSYRTLCGSEIRDAYLSCGDDPLTCMECALILDAEKLDDA